MPIQLENMKRFIPYFFCTFSALFLLFSNSVFGNSSSGAARITLEIPVNASPRVQFGAQKLGEALKKAGYSVLIARSSKAHTSPGYIAIGKSADKLMAASASLMPSQQKEAYRILTSPRQNVVKGFDDTGVLYGCLELASRIEKAGKLPATLNYSDKPEMVLRGTCIGIQKPALLPGHEIYEYPYTEKNFPWFYDKQLWIQYLDMMVENRYNSLYLWNGHPFASLVKLKDYPYAVEVDDATFKKNEEIFRFLTREADKRGIWVIQMFYNIIVSKPFADKHNIKTQDRNRPITPLLSDYTRKSIAAFVEKYPNVGLLLTLGEAMEGVGQDDIDWFTKTIIPGVQDGMKALGLKQEPPVVLRAHDTDAPAVMKAALPLYKNLYTMAKYNGEALTTYTPRGSWAELHRKLSRIGTVHIENVHILANLEPFRYSSPDFVQKSVLAMHNVYEANGLHLYPQASYWDWPYTADKAQKRLLQTDRDWMWYKVWARYAWNAHRDKEGEIGYWSDILAKKFNTTDGAAKDILEAYEQSGEISPKLLRRYGITDGNRQTLTLGMTMTQLINPFRYNLFTLMYESEAPEGEMIIEYAEKEWNNQAHKGETPVQVADEVEQHGKLAVEAIDKAAKYVDASDPEFRRLKNDIYCYDEMGRFYAQKVRAALHILRYKYSDDIADLEKALPFLESSVEHYRKLAALTKDTYLYANSMQTKQRKIPFRGVDATYIHWLEVLPRFEEELQHFKHSIDSLKQNKGNYAVKRIKPFSNVPVKVLEGAKGTYTIAKGASLFADTLASISEFAPELAGLNGYQLDRSLQMKQGTGFRFSAKVPVKVLVGYFNTKDPSYLAPPDLEHDATANNFGQSEIKIANALSAPGLPALNIHTYTFPAGTHTLSLAKGKALILGVIAESEPFRLYDAGIGVSGNKKDIDWLFE